AVGVAGVIDGLIATHRTYRLIAASANSALPNAINTLSDRDEVEMIWYDEPVHTMLDASVPLIGVPQVWDAGITGKDIKVAIVDTGIDPNHPDFANRIAEMKDFTGQGPADNHGHGTHVAGIVGGTGAGSSNKYRGVAPECLFYAAKVLRGDGSGSTSDVMAGVEWAVQQGAQVVNLSLGSDGACDGTDALSVLCDTATGKGVVMCIAAGNAGPGASTVGSPGCAKLVITVGATTKSDSVANFSSRGPTSDGRVKPDVCFPGASIVACRASGTSMGTPVNQLYTSASGTSMATPHAAGTCALLLQAKPGLSPQQIKDLLMDTAKDLGLDANTQGKGRAEAFAAYQSALGQEPQPPPTPPPPGPGCWETIKSVFTGR
ncbi:MAG: S8 family peptidase, partial [Chloroflexota bacterium]